MSAVKYKFSVRLSICLLFVCLSFFLCSFLSFYPINLSVSLSACMLFSLCVFVHICVLACEQIIAEKWPCKRMFINDTNKAYKIRICSPRIRTDDVKSGTRLDTTRFLFGFSRKLCFDEIDKRHTFNFCKCFEENEKQ